MNFVNAVSLLAFAGLAAAQTPSALTCENFELTITGVDFLWKMPVLPDDYSSEGVIDYVPVVGDGSSPGAPAPVSRINWGRSNRSGLKGDSTMVDFSFNAGNTDVFHLGDITHINMPIPGNTNIRGVTLCVRIHTNIPDYPTFDFNYDMNIHETPNQGECDYFIEGEEEVKCPDRVLIISNPEPQEIHVLPGDFKYELDLAGFSDESGGAIVDRLVSAEGAETSTGLYGSFFLTDCDQRGSGMGDPHFQTWTGHWYDFQGECDMHLLTVPEFEADTSLTIDIRTKTRDWYSYIEAAAIKLGDDILEVTGYGTYALNGVQHTPLTKNRDGKVMAGKFPVYHDPINKKTHEFTINLGGEEKIVVRTFKDLVSVTVVNARTKHFNHSGGMMGSFHTGAVTSRDGMNILTDPIEMAREWQVRDTETMLFTDAHGPQYPQKCVMPAKKEGPRLGKTIALIAAQEACSHWPKETMALCVDDVMKTGDVEVAEGERF